MQWKLLQRCTHLLYCSVLSLGGNVNTRRMSKPDIGSIFHINNQWNILVKGNYYVIYQNYQNSMLLISSDTKRTLSIYSCLQIPPRENWFQYVYVEYTRLQLTFLALHSWLIPCIYNTWFWLRFNDDLTVSVCKNYPPELLAFYK